VTIADYLDALKERLLTDALVSSFEVVRERRAATDGHLRARLVLTDDSRLEFSEYVQRSPDDQIQVITYSYHWTDAGGDLVLRWDNTPHYPNLPGFPHHVHEGANGTVSAGQPVSLFIVLDEIARRLAS